MAGEVSVAESNHDARKRAAKGAARGQRNARSPAEFKHQVVLPLWLDMPYCKRKAAEWGCTDRQAANRVFAELNS